MVEPSKIFTVFSYRKANLFSPALNQMDQIFPFARNYKFSNSPPKIQYLILRSVWRRSSTILLVATSLTTRIHFNIKLPELNILLFVADRTGRSSHSSKSPIRISSQKKNPYIRAHAFQIRVVHNKKFTIINVGIGYKKTRILSKPYIYSPSPRPAPHPILNERRKFFITKLEGNTASH